MTYWDKVAAHVESVVRNRQIADVLHFTLIEHLPTILEHGLQTRTELVNADYTAYVSDDIRRDNEDDAVSVSISCYYPKLFEKRRHDAGSRPLAILVLRPSLLWEYHCLFYRQGATTTATKWENAKRYGGFALEKLFEECNNLRQKYELPPNWPTFPGSEVQVMSPIHPDYIMGAWVETLDHGEIVKAAFNAARREGSIRVQPFEPRIGNKPYYWG